MPIGNEVLAIIPASNFFDSAVERKHWRKYTCCKRWVGWNQSVLLFENTSSFGRYVTLHAHSFIIKYFKLLHFYRTRSQDVLPQMPVNS